MDKTIFIPWPPSTNNLWRAVNGRNILSKRYRDWRISASKELMIQRPKRYPGPVRISIGLSAPTNHAFDLDNRAKAILDLLVHNGVIASDNSATVQHLTLSVSPKQAGAHVTIEALIG